MPEDCIDRLNEIAESEPSTLVFAHREPGNILPEFDDDTDSIVTSASELEFSEEESSSESESKSDESTGVDTEDDASESTGVDTSSESEEDCT